MNMNQDLRLVIEKTQKLFKSNIMLLNYGKTTFMQFSSNISYRSMVDTQSIDCKINLTSSIKFLGLTIESSLAWKKTY
jgi:glycerol-3-phosphate O-acyltransferase